MQKKICAYIFGITFIALSSIVHGQSGTASRGPSVDPIVEIDIEDAKKADTGYDFAATEAPAPVRQKTRVPANITTNTQAEAPTSYVGPIIFLIALPIGLWMMVSKRFNKTPEERKVGYFAKTSQFKPFTTEYQKSAEDDDDIDYPKAS